MKSKVTLIILIVIIVILGGTTIFLEYKYSQKSDEVVTLTSQLESINEQEESADEVPSQTEYVETVVEKYAITKFDEDKLVARLENTTGYSNNFYGCSLSGILRIDNNVVTYTFTGGTDYTCTYSFDERIVDALQWSTYDGASSVICFLTESGTVYVNYYDSATIPNSETYEKVEGLSNICRLYVTRASYTQGYWWTVVAVDTDGNAYDVVAAYSSK